VDQWHTAEWWIHGGCAGGSLCRWQCGVRDQSADVSCTDANTCTHTTTYRAIVAIDTSIDTSIVAIHTSIDTVHAVVAIDTAIDTAKLARVPDTTTYTSTYYLASRCFAREPGCYSTGRLHLPA
jgi:hypothetical protein